MVPTRDIFVAKFSSDGALLWAKQAGGAAYDGGLGIALDPTGNSLVTGWFTDSATFGAGEPNETRLTAVGSEDAFVANDDVFVAKYAPDGSLLWAKQASGHGVGVGVAVDADGNGLVTGGFSGSVTFGAGEPNETLLLTWGDSDIFVAKYAADGSLLWAKQAGSTPATAEVGDGASRIAVDADGNGLVTGWFRGWAIFGAGEPNETALTAVGGVDIFAAKFAP